jgi:hypothetical protein
MAVAPNSSALADRGPACVVVRPVVGLDEYGAAGHGVASCLELLLTASKKIVSLHQVLFLSRFLAIATADRHPGGIGTQRCCASTTRSTNFSHEPLEAMRLCTQVPHTKSPSSSNLTLCIATPFYYYFSAPADEWHDANDQPPDGRGCM